MIYSLARALFTKNIITNITLQYVPTLKCFYPDQAKGRGSAHDLFWGHALFTRWTMILSYYFPNVIMVMKIYKFILYKTSMIGLQQYYSVVKDLFHTKTFFVILVSPLSSNPQGKQAIVRGKRSSS